ADGATTTQRGTWTGVTNNYVFTPVASLGKVQGAFEETTTDNFDGLGDTSGTETFTSSAGKIFQTFSYGPVVPAGFRVSVTATPGDEGTSRRLAMTKQGSFKRAVRQRARQSGERYTEARAALEKGKSAERPTRPFDLAAIRTHLEENYGIGITSVAPIDDPES